MPDGRLMLDPADWLAFRALAHRMLDDALDGLQMVADGPPWRPTPDAVKAALAGPVPRAPRPLAQVYADFATLIAPYATGNRHPRFVGWVHGNGTPSGMLAEMLAASLNANTGGREHAAVYVERAVIAWSAELFGFPAGASGILTSGTSLANLIAVVVARRAALGAAVRHAGIGGRRLTAYASAAVHRCVPDAFDVAGLGSDALRRVALTSEQRIDRVALAAAIARDRAAGDEPFMVVATAGSVDCGAIDELDALADLCRAESLWLHVDGAFGALAILSPEQRRSLAGIERADSLAFDFHKWLHVPYDAGCLLVRDAALHRASFAGDAPYLTAAPEGPAAGQPWFADLGPELSRRFRALGIWFAFMEHGTERLGAAIARNCRQAARLAERVADVAELELAAPVALNVVCLRYRAADRSPTAHGELHAAIALDLARREVGVVSTTAIDGRSALRINLTNHRITDDDLDALLAGIVAAGDRLTSGATEEGARA